MTSFLMAGTILNYRELLNPLGDIHKIKKRQVDIIGTAKIMQRFKISSSKWIKINTQMYFISNSVKPKQQL